MANNTTPPYTGPLKVAAETKPASLAGSIAGHIREGIKRVELDCIGASAINQATKAVAIANGYINTQGLYATILPTFVDTNVNGEEKTGMRLILMVHKIGE